MRLIHGEPRWVDAAVSALPAAGSRTDACTLQGQRLHLDVRIPEMHGIRSVALRERIADVEANTVGDAAIAHRLGYWRYSLENGDPAAIVAEDECRQADRWTGVFDAIHAEFGVGWTRAMARPGTELEPPALSIERDGRYVDFTSVGRTGTNRLSGAMVEMLTDVERRHFVGCVVGTRLTIVVGPAPPIWLENRGPIERLKQSNGSVRRVPLQD